MALADLEADLFRRLSESRILEAGGYEARPQPAVHTELSDIAGIGLDTNILKQFRREPLLADTLSTRLAEAGVALIIPSQCVIEFWNNHHVFAKDDLKNVTGDISKLRKSLERVRALAIAEDRLAHVQSVIDELARDLDESTAPNFLDSSRSVMNTVLSFAIQPSVSRSRFAEVASVRQRSKIPPDSPTKQAKGRRHLAISLRGATSCWGC